MRGQGAEQRPLPRDAVVDALPERPVDPHVGDLVEPSPRPRVEVVVGHEVPVVEEVPRTVADRALNLALRLRAVRGGTPGSGSPRGR